MESVWLLIPVSVILVFVIAAIFWWSVRSGQFDDLDGPAHSILFDDEDPKHQAAVNEVHEQQTPTKPDESGKTDA